MKKREYYLDFSIKKRGRNGNKKIILYFILLFFVSFGIGYGVFIFAGLNLSESVSQEQKEVNFLLQEERAALREKGFSKEIGPYGLWNPEE